MRWGLLVSVSGAGWAPTEGIALDGGRIEVVVEAAASSRLQRLRYPPNAGAAEVKQARF